jgi:hypothetical protein
MSAMRAGERETSKSVLRGGDDEDEYVREVSKPRSAASRQTPARATARDESVNESNAAAAGNAD